MFQQLVKHPAYIFKFAIYLLFISFAVLFYVSDILAVQDKTLKIMYSAILFLYGAYRLVRTYQEFKAETRHEE